MLLSNHHLLTILSHRSPPTLNILNIFIFSFLLHIFLVCCLLLEPLTIFTSLRSVRFLLHRAMPSYRLVLLVLHRHIRQSLPPYRYVSSCPDTQSFLQDVDRSVNITVMMTPTIWTIPFPDIQSFLACQLSTRGAYLAGWIELIYFDNFFSIPVSLVLKHPHKL